MLPGERHRDRVLRSEEETRCLDATTALGENMQESYRRALEGIRATMRGEQPIEPEDAFLLRDVLGPLAQLAIHAKLRNRPHEFDNGKGKWSGREDSNLRPPGPEPGALPS